MAFGINPKKKRGENYIFNGIKHSFLQEKVVERCYCQCWWGKWVVQSPCIRISKYQSNGKSAETFSNTDQHCQPTKGLITLTYFAHQVHVAFAKGDIRRENRAKLDLVELFQLAHNRIHISNPFRRQRWIITLGFSGDEVPERQVFQQIYFQKQLFSTIPHTTVTRDKRLRSTPTSTYILLTQHRTKRTRLVQIQCCFPSRCKRRIFLKRWNASLNQGTHLILVCKMKQTYSHIHIHGARFCNTHSHKMFIDCVYWHSLSLSFFLSWPTCRVTVHKQLWEKRFVISSFKITHLTKTFCCVFFTKHTNNHCLNGL